MYPMLQILGLPIPNDMQCHLNEKGEFSESMKYDYPSISQVTYITTLLIVV